MQRLFILSLVFACLAVAIAASAADPGRLVWQRLLLDDARDLRLRAAALDADGEIVLVHTERAPGASIVDGTLAAWRIGASDELRASLALPDEHGERHTGWDALPMVLGRERLALALRTTAGLSLLTFDADSFAPLDARQRRNEDDPLLLLAAPEEGYRLVTSRRLWFWPAADEPVIEWQLDDGVHAAVAAVQGGAIALIAFEADPEAGLRPLAGVARGGAPTLVTADPRVRAAPGRTRLLTANDQLALLAPSAVAGVASWWRLRFDRDMAMVGAESFDLPFESGQRTGFGRLFGVDEALVVSGGPRGYWLAAAGWGPQGGSDVLFEPPVDAAWALSMDLQTLPGPEPGMTYVAATYAYPDAEAGRVRYGLHVQLVAFEDRGDTHAAGSANGD